MSNEAKFTIFCMENYKAHRNLTGKQVAELFQKYDVYDYLYNFYDVLHTTGYKYVNNDSDIYLEVRNAEFPSKEEK